MIISDILSVFDNQPIDKSLLFSAKEAILSSADVSNAGTRFKEFVGSHGVAARQDLLDMFVALTLLNALYLATIEQAKKSDAHMTRQSVRHRFVDIWGSLLGSKAALAELAGDSTLGANGHALDARTRAVAELVFDLARQLEESAAPLFGLAAIAGLLDAVRELLSRALPLETLDKSLRYIADL